MGIVARTLSLPVLTYFGDRSYSIYLWQGPLIGFAAILFATPGAIALAALASIIVAVATYARIEWIFSFATSWGRAAPRRSISFAAAFLAAALVCIAIHYLVPITVARLQAAAPLRATFLDDKRQRQRGTLGIKPCGSMVRLTRRRSFSSETRMPEPYHRFL